LGKIQVQLRVELFGRNSEVEVCFNKGNMIHIYLGYNIIAVQKQLLDIVSLVKEMSGKGTSVVYSTHFVNKGIL
jgi:hypothetical protein